MSKPFTEESHASMVVASLPKQAGMAASIACNSSQPVLNQTLTHFEDHTSCKKIINSIKPYSLVSHGRLINNVNIQQTCTANHVKKVKPSQSSVINFNSAHSAHLPATAVPMDVSKEITHNHNSVSNLMVPTKLCSTTTVPIISESSHATNEHFSNTANCVQAMSSCKMRQPIKLFTSALPVPSVKANSSILQICSTDVNVTKSFASSTDFTSTTTADLSNIVASTASSCVTSCALLLSSETHSAPVLCKNASLSVLNHLGWSSDDNSASNTKCVPATTNPLHCKAGAKSDSTLIPNTRLPPASVCSVNTRNKKIKLIRSPLNIESRIDNKCSDFSRTAKCKVISGKNESEKSDESASKLNNKGELLSNSFENNFDTCMYKQNSSSVTTLSNYKRKKDPLKSLSEEKTTSHGNKCCVTDMTSITSACENAISTSDKTHALVVTAPVTAASVISSAPLNTRVTFNKPSSVPVISSPPTCATVSNSVAHTSLKFTPPLTSDVTSTSPICATAITAPVSASIVHRTHIKCDKIFIGVTNESIVCSAPVNTAVTCTTSAITTLTFSASGNVAVASDRSTKVAVVCNKSAATAVICCVPTSDAKSCSALTSTVAACIPLASTTALCIARTSMAVACITSASTAVSCVTPTNTTAICITPVSTADACIAPRSTTSSCLTPTSNVQSCIAPASTAVVFCNSSISESFNTPAASNNVPRTGAMACNAPAASNNVPRTGAASCVLPANDPSIFESNDGRDTVRIVPCSGLLLSDGKNSGSEICSASSARVSSTVQLSSGVKAVDTTLTLKTKTSAALTLSKMDSSLSGIGTSSCGKVKQREQFLTDVRPAVRTLAGGNYNQWKQSESVSTSSLLQKSVCEHLKDQSKHVRNDILCTSKPQDGVISRLNNESIINKSNEILLRENNLRNQISADNLLDQEHINNIKSVIPYLGSVNKECKSPFSGDRSYSTGYKDATSIDVDIMRSDYVDSISTSSSSLLNSGSTFKPIESEKQSKIKDAALIDEVATSSLTSVSTLRTAVDSVSDPSSSKKIAKVFHKSNEDSNCNNNEPSQTAPSCKMSLPSLAFSFYSTALASSCVSHCTSESLGPFGDSLSMGSTQLGACSASARSSHVGCGSTSKLDSMSSVTPTHYVAHNNKTSSLTSTNTGFDGTFCQELLESGEAMERKLRGECEDEDEFECDRYLGVDGGAGVGEEDCCDDVPHKPVFEMDDTSGMPRRRSSLKRKRQEEENEEPNTAETPVQPPLNDTTIVQHTAASSKRPRRSIKFDGVTVFYFPRSQGFSCVPSQGGSTLGMARRHFHIRKFSITEHVVEQRRLHKLNRLKRMAEEEVCECSSNCYHSQAKRDLPESVTATVSAFDNTNNSITVTNISETTSDASSAINGVTDATNSKVGIVQVQASSDDDTEEDGSELSESEMESDFCYLQPLAIRQRRSLLRESGIKAIESIEKEECKDIRISRELCGCQCKLYCFPDTCQCIEAGIKCQVDRHNFPCGCSVQGCNNPHGRIEFNPIRVRTHFLHTLMRLEIEKRQAEQRALFQQQQRSRWEDQRHRWLACLEGEEGHGAEGHASNSTAACVVGNSNTTTSSSSNSGDGNCISRPYQPAPIELVRQTCWLDSRGMVAEYKAEFKEGVLPPFACGSCDFPPMDTFGGCGSRSGGGVWGGSVFGSDGFSDEGSSVLSLAPSYTRSSGYYPPLDDADSLQLQQQQGSANSNNNIVDGGMAVPVYSLGVVGSDGVADCETPALSVPSSYLQPIPPTQLPHSSTSLESSTNPFLEYSRGFLTDAGSDKQSHCLPGYPPLGYDPHLQHHISSSSLPHGLSEDQHSAGNLSGKSFGLDFGFLDSYGIAASTVSSCRNEVVQRSTGLPGIVSDCGAATITPCQHFEERSLSESSGFSGFECTHGGEISGQSGISASQNLLTNKLGIVSQENCMDAGNFKSKHFSIAFEHASVQCNLPNTSADTTALIESKAEVTVCETKASTSHNKHAHLFTSSLVNAATTTTATDNIGTSFIVSQSVGSDSVNSTITAKSLESALHQQQQPSAGAEVRGDRLDQTLCETVLG